MKPRVTINIDPNLHRRVRVAAAARGCTIVYAASEALTAWIGDPEAAAKQAHSAFSVIPIRSSIKAHKNTEGKARKAA